MTSTNLMRTQWAVIGLAVITIIGERTFLRNLPPFVGAVVWATATIVVLFGGIWLIVMGRGRAAEAGGRVRVGAGQFAIRLGVAVAITLALLLLVVLAMSGNISL
ncbi:MAG TPA: hypothetical protein VI322_05280 [Candidatus Saccharimonadia bacterium]